MLNHKKIIVIGCSGAGKSTFSKQLAEITGLPLYHLDNIYWLPDATHLKRHEFVKRQKAIMKNDSWVIDGNYRKTVECRLKECDLVYFFDMPTEVCIAGVLKRDRKREDIACELEPNEELINDIWSYRDHVRPRMLALFKRYPDKKIIVFKSHNEVDEYLKEMRLCYGLDV